MGWRLRPTRTGATQVPSPPSGLAERPPPRSGFVQRPLCRLRSLQCEQSREFLIRGEVMKPLEVIQSATTVAARVLRQEGKLGVIAPGAAADLPLVDGNPLDDLGLFQDQGAHLGTIMKGGSFHKRRGRPRRRSPAPGLSSAT